MLKKQESLLGVQASYPKKYNSALLHPIPRKKGRTSIGINTDIFYGADIWNAYEVSWLDLKGKPIVAAVQIIFQCNTKNIVESKSLKLYFNSMNQAKFESKDKFLSLIKADITSCAEGEVKITIYDLEDLCDQGLSTFSGILLDNLDVSIDTYYPDPTLLVTSNAKNSVMETLFSHLLKTNCPVTNQPDWATLMIRYKGKPIDKSSLLKYIVSYRNQQDFHEQCVERIYQDILTICRPHELKVYARYTRRGGLDINPYRSSKISSPPIARISRQ